MNRMSRQGSCQSAASAFKRHRRRKNVNRKSFEIFVHMLTPITDKAHSGDLNDWRRFVPAVADTGCNARSSGGSAVTSSNGNGRVIFLKPNPVKRRSKDAAFVV